MSVFEASYTVDSSSSASLFHAMTVVAIVLAGISILWSFADPRMVGDADYRMGHGSSIPVGNDLYGVPSGTSRRFELQLQHAIQ